MLVVTWTFKSGVITAPVSNLYHFSFTTYACDGDSNVYPRVNGSVVAQSLSTEYNNLPIFATLILQKGDKVDIWFDGGSLSEDFSKPLTLFTTRRRPFFPIKLNKPKTEVTWYVIFLI